MREAENGDFIKTMFQLQRKGGRKHQRLASTLLHVKQQERYPSLFNSISRIQSDVSIHRVGSVVALSHAVKDLPRGASLDASVRSHHSFDRWRKRETWACCLIKVAIMRALSHAVKDLPRGASLDAFVRSCY